MGNSIRTTANTQTTTNSTPATFKAGDSVLCPSLSISPFTLTHDPYGKRDLLAITYDGSYHYYNDQGYFVLDSDTETGDYNPSLFHDTPANRQAINTLYGSKHQIKTIDCTDADDDEVILMPSIMLSDIACDINAAATALHDMGQLFHLIANRKLEPYAVIAMARLSQDAADTWINLLYSQLEIINEPLAQTGFGKVDACAY